MSAVFLGSPDSTTWLFRMVYFSDADGYDLLPEYRFGPANLGDWPRTHNIAGATVQDLRVERRRHDTQKEDEDGISAEGGGVRLLRVSHLGAVEWWTARRNDLTDVGVDEIVV